MHFFARNKLLFGWLTMFLVGTDLFIISPFLPAIAADMHSTPASLGVLVGGFSIAYALLCPLQGQIAERTGARKVLAFGITSLVLANLATAWATTLPLLIASRCFAGLAAASISPMIYALTAASAPPERRAFSLAIVNSGLVLSLVGGAPVGMMIAAWSDWRDVFVLIAILLAMMLPFNLRCWPVTASAPSPSASHAGSLRGAWVFLVTMVAWSVAVYTSYTYLGSALALQFASMPGTVAMLIACYGAGATLGGLSGGKLADRYGAHRVVQGSFVMMAVAFGALAALYAGPSTRQPPLLGPALFAVALVSFGLFPALQACAAKVFPSRRASVMALMGSSLYVGITLGSVTGGAIYADAGFHWVATASSVLAGLGLLISIPAMRAASDEPMPAFAVQQK
ncbi:MFS transporter [Duganella sp. FT92W]|uniref:MFS transporter n=1 Tax=Pseudoduganella rivuli TaxID=2666085 RepID=A0A7X2IQD3_9BURK|nr:MFS transporter [Pseudoduganella rivuli]MRV74094.1 MFS transporter [Pseudoduganella rivuli]